MSDSKLEDLEREGIWDAASEVIPPHIISEAMNVARAFPLESNSNILSILTTHKSKSSAVRARITVSSLIQEMKMKESVAQIYKDALIIHRIFPHLSIDTLTIKLELVEDKPNRIQLVSEDILINWKSSSSFDEMPKRKLVNNVADDVPKKQFKFWNPIPDMCWSPILANNCSPIDEMPKRKLVKNVTDNIPKKLFKFGDPILANNWNQSSLSSNEYPDKVSETSVLDNDKSTSYENTTNKKESINHNHLTVPFVPFADCHWNLPSTSKSTDINIPVTNEQPSSTTFVDDSLSLSSDSIELKAEDWNMPSTSKNTNINVPVTKELPSSTTTVENASLSDLIVDVKVEDRPTAIVEIEDRNSPTLELAEIEIKETVIIDLVNEPKRIKIYEDPAAESDSVDNTLYYKLMEIFPEADPLHLRKLCNNKVYSQIVLNDLINALLSDDYPKRSQQPAEEENEDQPIDPVVQIEILKQVLPDADPTYLAKSLERISSQDELKMFITRALETKDYPTYKEYLRKQQINAQAKQYTKEFDVEKFINLIPDPETYFSKLKAVTIARRYDQSYYDTLEFLKNHYTHIYSNHIKCVFDKSLNILHTCADLDACKEKLMRSKRKSICTLENVTNIPLLQIFAYIKHKKLISDFIENKKKQKELEREEMKRNGLMITCGCCFDDEVIPTDSANCPNGCIFCKCCIAKSVEVAFGEGKLEYPCLSGCDNQFSVQTLQDALKPKLFSKIAQKKQMEEVKAAGIEDLECCPFCDFASIPPVGDKLFKCLNPECMKESCRQCKESSHVPLRCDEVERDDDVKRRIFVEDKMTEALLRKCWKCGMKFIKSDGCNKMTCTCGAHMCYICNKPVTDYKHFNGQGGDKYNLCPLYSDTNLLHKEAVMKSAEAAKTEIGADGLKIDPTADIQDYYKNLMKKRPTNVPPGVYPAVFARDPAAMGQHRHAQGHRGHRHHRRRN